MLCLLSLLLTLMMRSMLRFTEFQYQYGEGNIWLRTVVLREPHRFRTSGDLENQHGEGNKFALFVLVSVFVLSLLKRCYMALLQMHSSHCIYFCQI